MIATNGRRLGFGRSEPGRALSLTRRGLLAAGGVAALSACSGGGGGGGGRSLRVSTYGGNFEQAMADYLYPRFTEATGIRVESIPQPAGLQFLIQLIEANKAGQPPMDLCITAPVDVMRGRRAGLWRVHDTSKVPNLANLPQDYVSSGPSGVDAIGVVGWYLTMVANPDLIQPVPSSWAELWAPNRLNAWGLSGGGTSLLYEITAATFFGGAHILETEEGIREVLPKIAELKPNTKLWWESEGAMQTALENGEVKGGTYFADVARTLKESGTPLEIVFPKEGPVIDFGSWCQPSASTKTAEALEFINFMLTPEAQGLIATQVHAPPLIRPELLAVPPTELARVASPTRPIAINVKARAQHLDFMAAQFTQMLAA